MKKINKKIIIIGLIIVVLIVYYVTREQIFRGKILFNTDPVEKAWVSISPFITGVHWQRSRDFTDSTGRFYISTEYKHIGEQVLIIKFDQNDREYVYKEIIKPRWWFNNIKLDIGKIVQISGKIVDSNGRLIGCDYILFKGKNKTYVTDSDYTGEFQLRILPEKSKDYVVYAARPVAGPENVEEVAMISMKDGENLIIKTEYAVNFPYIRRYDELPKKDICGRGNAMIFEIDAVGINGKEGLTYEWSSTGGKITGGGERIEWYAPEELGNYTVSVKVTDVTGLNLYNHHISVHLSYLYHSLLFQFLE